MRKLIVLLYQVLPKSWIHWIGQAHWLDSLRYKLLRPSGAPMLTQVQVNWQQRVSFKFSAPVKIALKAKEKGLENSLLKHTLAKFEHRDDLIIFDIGASFGFLSMVWAKTLAQKGHIYSFEPHPQLHQILLQNIGDNHLRETISANHNLVGESNEPRSLKLMGYTSNKEAIAHKKVTAEITVNQITLDSFMQLHTIEKVDLIKIDVDGSEMYVLEGMKQLLQRCAPLVIIETNNEALTPLMQQYGYHAYKLRPDYTGNEPVNIFYEKIA